MKWNTKIFFSKKKHFCSIFKTTFISRSIAANHNFAANYEKIITMRIFLILRMLVSQFCLKSVLIIMKK